MANGCGRAVDRSPPWDSVPGHRERASGGQMRRRRVRTGAVVVAALHDGGGCGRRSRAAALAPVASSRGRHRPMVDRTHGARRTCPRCRPRCEPRAVRRAAAARGLDGAAAPRPAAILDEVEASGLRGRGRAPYRPVGSGERWPASRLDGPPRGRERRTRWTGARSRIGRSSAPTRIAVLEGAIVAVGARGPTVSWSGSSVVRAEIERLATSVDAIKAAGWSTASSGSWSRVRPSTSRRGDRAARGDRRPYPFPRDRAAVPARCRRGRRVGGRSHVRAGLSAHVEMAGADAAPTRRRRSSTTSRRSRT